jgi:xanthine dehydrogenase/oxidase
MFWHCCADILYRLQTTGEAVYPSDEPLPPQGLCGALVFTSQCGAILSAIDTSSAMAVPGVVAFISASDIPGENLVGSDIPLYVPIGEEVQCIGAPVGLIVATSDEIANRAASLVRISYVFLGKTPLVTLPQAIAAQSFFDVPVVVSSIYCSILYEVFDVK